jgi:citrate lyase beta subunit
MLALQPTTAVIASAAKQLLIAMRMAGANLNASVFSDGEQTVRTAAQRRASRNAGDGTSALHPPDSTSLARLPRGTSLTGAQCRGTSRASPPSLSL